jgi:hypothetical protein
VEGMASRSKEGQTRHGPARAHLRLPHYLAQTAQVALHKASPCEMDTDPEFKIQTRFEKHAEFVALQNEALSWDISPQASDEESNRRINLMRDMVKIVR